MLSFIDLIRRYSWRTDFYILGTETTGSYKIQIKMVSWE